MELQGKVALVTGAAMGMGAMHAQWLVAAGAEVAVTDVHADEAVRGGERIGPGLLCVWLNQTTSRGSLELRSPDPDIQPVIDQNQLSERPDLVRLREGIHRALELLDTPAFKEIVDRVAIDAAGRGIEGLGTNEDIDRWLLATGGDTAHICGTCRMGDADEPTTVVDPLGRVLGVDGLWVADASVFPEVPRANTNLPTMAAAERLSDLVRGLGRPQQRST